MNDSDADHLPEPTPTEPPGESPVASGLPFMEHFRPPRLGIIHLLAWTAATAVFLKFRLAAEAASPSRGVPSGFVLEAVRFIYVLGSAAGVVGLAILVRGWWRGACRRLQPGHWLILVIAPATLLNYISYSVRLLFSLTSPETFLDNYKVLVGLWGLSFLFCAGVWFWAAWQTSDGRRWKVLFGILCAVNTIRVLACLLDIILPYSHLAVSGQLFWLLVTGIPLAITVLLDWIRGPRRDWLHWLGVGIIGCQVLSQAAWYVWIMFFRQFS